ncbi:hypothetical protein Tco_1210011 [Tanacetum coccineum]
MISIHPNLNTKIKDRKDMKDTIIPASLLSSPTDGFVYVRKPRSFVFRCLNLTRKQASLMLSERPLVPKRPVQTLSGSQKQRVAIAGALVEECKECISGKEKMDIHQKVPLVSDGVCGSIPWMKPGLPRGKSHLGNEGVANNSFASILKANNLTPYAFSNSSPAIVLDDSCILEKDLSCAVMGKIKDINARSNLYVILNNKAAKEKLIKHVGVSSWFSELCPANNSSVSDVRLVWIVVEGLPICAWNNNALAKIVSSWGTLSDVDVVDDASLPFKKLCVLEAWGPKFDNEFCDNSSSDEESVGGERNASL